MKRQQLTSYRILVSRALHQLSIYDAKVEPDLSLIAVIQLADMIMNLWQRYIATALVPLASGSVTARREMGIFNNNVVGRIEGKVNAIVQSATDGEWFPSHDIRIYVRARADCSCVMLLAILSWLAILLSKQKKLDFKPRNDDAAFARMNTEPCLLACEFLHKVRVAAGVSLTGRNAEVFLTEVGVTFHTFVFPFSFCVRSFSFGNGLTDVGCRTACCWII